MVTRKGCHRVETRERARNGTGTLTLVHLAEAQQMLGHGRLFAKAVLQPGDSIGLHTHQGETELFYILSGTARVWDDGRELLLQPGDTLCTPSGGSHCIEAAGDSPLEYIALILLA